MQLQVKVDTSKAAAMAAEARRRIPSAIATALTRTAQINLTDQQREMRRVFDRPTPWTIGGIAVKAATPRDLASRVYLKEESGSGIPTSKYLRTEISGGARSVKRFEKALQAAGVLPAGMLAVPGPGAKLDDYGNMSAGQIVQVISFFKQQPAEGQKQIGVRTMTEKRKVRLAKSTVSRAGFTYFAVGKDEHGLHPGVWQRFASGAAKGQMAASRGGLVPVLLFVDGATYQARYDFEGVTERTVKRVFPDAFRQAMVSNSGYVPR